MTLQLIQDRATDDRSWGRRITETINALLRSGGPIPKLSLTGPEADVDHTLIDAKSGGQTFQLRYDAASNALMIGLSGSGVLSFMANDIGQMNIVDGNVFFTSNTQLRALAPIGLTDGVTAPSTVSGVAQLYVDSADGDLKIMFGDGTVAKIADDSGDGTFTATLTGVSGSVTGTARYSVSGNTVCLYVPALTGTSTTTACTITGMPSSIIPARNQTYFSPSVINNSVVGWGTMYVDTSGVIQLAPADRTFNWSAWTAANTKGLNAAQVITYTLL